MRKVLEVKECMRTFEGDGIPVTRAFPVPGMREVDPFLLFDHFGPIHYEPRGATGVPAHPHCGFEAIAYLLSGLSGLFFYKKTIFKIEINNQIIETTCLMALIGICKYAAGGMKLTNYTSTSNGFFDITIVKNLSLIDLIRNLPKLYNGKIIHHKKVDTYKSNSIYIMPISSYNKPFIQADGELIGKGSLKATIIPKAIQFVIP